jgi:hypothetical protein
VTLACGHARPLAQLLKQRCQQCLDADRKEANERRARMRAARRADLPPHFRLPDGSTMLASYDATARRWSGVLEVPGLAAVNAEEQTALRLIDALGLLAYRLLAAGQADVAGDEERSTP